MSMLHAVPGPVYSSVGSAVLSSTTLRQEGRRTFQPGEPDEGRTGLRNVRWTLVRPDVEQVRAAATLSVGEHRGRRFTDETVRTTAKHRQWVDNRSLTHSTDTIQLLQ